MSKQTDWSPHDPGWSGVILGVALSVALGVIVGAAVLVFKPVVVVKERPKEPAAGVTYFIEGARDSNKAKQAAAKWKALAQGAAGTFAFTEDELNTLIAPATPAAAAKAKLGEKGAPLPATGELLKAGTPNFRIRDGVVQIGFPVTVSALGADVTVIVQAQGVFAKKGDGFAFEPDTLTVGSCPVQRLPYAPTYARNKFLAAQTGAEDMAAVWSKVVSVAVEGNTLNLTMP